MQKPMKKSCFAIAWNEERLIEQYLEWYSFADSITILDNYSTDRTVEIALSRGCTVEQYGIEGALDDREILKVKNNCWKNSDADWVIVGDMDEFLYHPNLVKLLDTTDATVIQAKGYHMISEEPDLCKNVKTGCYDSKYNKSICFKPKEIDDMGWNVGCHFSTPVGKNIKILVGEVKMLHFSYIGRQKFKDRWALTGSRLSVRNKEQDWGLEYLWPDELKDARFNEILRLAEVVW
jgi:glycosyltransferase involved in cell wall biosynthesis